MKKLAITLGVLVLPVVSFAQGTGGDLGVFKRMATSVSEIVGILIPVVFALGILAFFWGLVKYLFGADHDKDQAKKTMLWGVIAVFIMASIWGLVRFIGTSFGVATDGGAVDVDNLNPLQ